MVSALIFDELSPAFLKKNQFCESDIGALVSAACVAHDIGNPPFGHSGEDSVSYYFKTENPDILFDNILKLNNSEKKMWNDLINFEGNANGFRIITKNCEKGINPTFALLGTFTKYPRESLLISDPYGRLPKKQKPKSQRKHGFFQEQRTLFLSVAKELGLLPIPNLHKDDIAFFRHPLAFLTEAADDISYLMIDFEDYPAKNGMVPFAGN